MTSRVVFVLLPDAGALTALLAGLPSCLGVRLYRAADDRRHLLSMVRDARDPAATTWRAGVVKSVGLGAALGALTNGVLCGGFGMLGGLLEVALPLGAALGAFLGGFTAAMTGTQRACAELRELAAAFEPGMVMAQVSLPTADCAALRERCRVRGVAHRLRGG